MRIVKVTAIAVVGLVGVVLLALLAVWLLVDPNDYKDRIAAAAKESTGRDLALPGTLKLSVFPWISIETGEASLGNPAGFGTEPFLTLKRAKLAVKLMPLLSNRLEVARIEIEGLNLALKQNAAGKGNWEDWGEDAGEESASSGGGSQTVDLAGISIKDSRIAFEDKVAQELNVDIGRVAPGRPISVGIKLNLVTAPGEKPLPLDANFELTLDLDKQHYQLKDLKLKGAVQPAGAPQTLDWNFEAPAADLDLAAQTLAQTTFVAQIGAAKVSGEIAAATLVDSPALTGKFQLAELAPRELLQQFGIAPPVTRDKSVLARFAAQGAYAWQAGVASLSKLAFTLDESKLGGRFAYDTGNSGMDFALTLDRIDLDRYQPPPTDPGTASAPIELPVDFLKPLRAKGSFAVGDIKIGGAKLTQLSAGIDVADGVARFAPLKAQLYGGQYNGNIGLDMRPAVPRLTMDEHMSGIDIAAFMQAYADSKRLSGRGNLDVKLAASGRSGDALLKTLTGTIDTNLQNGAVEGIDVWYAIAQAQSLIQSRQLATTPNTKRTVFETFRASAEVVNGVATTDDLTIASQLLRITGSGSTNLVTQTLNYSIATTVLKAPPGAEDAAGPLVRATIPVKVTGTFADPKVRPDLAGMAKERVKQEVEKRREEVEDKVKDKVKNKLKGLLGGKN